MSQVSMALALPIKYQDPEALGLVSNPDSESSLIINEGSSNKVRLGPVRNSLFNWGVDGATLVNYASMKYVEWVHQTEYLVFGRYNPFKGYKEFKAVKASKRGNDVYAKRVHDRFSKVMDLPNIRFFNYKDRSRSHKTRAFFITLEYNANNLTIGEAWNNVGVDYNRFLANIRNNYGEISVVRVWESHKSGYPHIHAIILFKEAEFTAFHYNGIWRIREKRDIEAYWPHGFSDIEALSSTLGGLHYVSKYLKKLHGAGVIDGHQEPGPYADEAGLSGLPSRASLLTLSLMWIFRKRAFSISGNWADVIEEMHFSKLGANYLSQDMLVQVDLEGMAPPEPVLKWVLLGFFSGRLKMGSKLVWSADLSLSQLRDIQGSPCYTENMRGR